MVSLKHFDSIFNTHEFNFKDVPEEIINRIDDLLLTVAKADVLLGLAQLKPLFDERVNKGRLFGGSSGLAMQELMVDEMKQFYLSKVNDYVESHVNIIFRAAAWQADRQALMLIRDLVFIQEQNVSLADEWDDKDETATHFLVSLVNGSAIACARVLCEGNLYHIGRVAVLAEYRNKTIGRQLMQFILSWCQQQKPEFKIYLHAQTSRIAFYEYLGFIAEGDVFMDAGIEHIEMWHKI